MLARMLQVAVVFIVYCAKLFRAGVKNLPLQFSLGFSVGRAQEG